MSLVHRHQYLRRRGLATTSPKSKRLVRGIDALAYCASSLSLFFTLDQVRIIWIDHNAAGLSMLAWVFYTLSSCIWLGYGVLHKEKVIMVTNSLWIVMNFAVVSGILLYGV